MEDKPDTSYEENAELNPFTHNAKSSVEIKQTTKGPTWKIKVVTGEKDLIEDLMIVAIKVYKEIKTNLNSKKEEN